MQDESLEGEFAQEPYYKQGDDDFPHANAEGNRGEAQKIVHRLPPIRFQAEPPKEIEADDHENADDANNARQEPYENVAGRIRVRSFRADVLARLRVVAAIQAEDVLFIHEVGAIGTAAALVHIGDAVGVAAFLLFVQDGQDRDGSFVMLGRMVSFGKSINAGAFLASRLCLGLRRQLHLKTFLASPAADIFPLELDGAFPRLAAMRSDDGIKNRHKVAPVY